MSAERGNGRRQSRQVLEIAGLAVLGGVFILLLRNLLYPSGEVGQTIGAPPTTDFNATKLAPLTAQAQTQDAAAMTPPRPERLNSPTADLRPSATPNYSDVPHRMTDGGVIFWRPDLSWFAECAKGSDEELPYLFVNAWVPSDGSPMIVYAGSFGAGASPVSSSVFSYTFPETDPCRPDVHLAPAAEGPLEIIDAEGHTLFLRSQSSGRYSSFNVDDSQFGEAVPTPTPSVTPTPAAGPRPPTDLEDYVLIGSRSAVLGPGVQIQTGNIGVNTNQSSSRLDVGTNVKFAAGTTASAYNISFAQGAVMPGIVFYNNLEMKPGAKVTGQRISPVGLPLLTFPDVPAFDIAGDAVDVTIAAGESQTIPCVGEADELIIRPRGTLLLGMGTCEVRRLTLEADSRLECMGECELRVLESVTVGPRAFLGVSQWLDPAGFVIWIVRQGGVGFEAGSRSIVEGKILAPKAGVVLGVDGIYMGTFVGETIEVKARAVLYQSSPFGLPQE